jgi:hypothetical protein
MLPAKWLHPSDSTATTGVIVIFSEEATLPYHRPSPSKAFHKEEARRKCFSAGGLDHDRQ